MKPNCFLDYFPNFLGCFVCLDGSGVSFTNKIDSYLVAGVQVHKKAPQLGQNRTQGFNDNVRMAKLSKKTLVMIIR